MEKKRRKPEAQRKTSYVHIRATKAHIEEIKAAADHAGISVSAWALERLLRTAREEAERS